MDRNGEGYPQPEESSQGSERFLNRRHGWFEKNKGNLLVTATVIASMSFQIMVSPPGGVRQEATCPEGTKLKCREKIGTAVFAHVKSKRWLYRGMVISCMVSFTSSLSFIILTISGVGKRNKSVKRLLISFMSVAAYFLVMSFMLGIGLVQSEDRIVYILIQFHFAFWILFIILSFLIYINKTLTKDPSTDAPTN